MKPERNEKIPNPKELEKEIGEFLSKKFGGNVKIVSPAVLPQEATAETDAKPDKTKRTTLDFDLKPEDLIAYLDQYIIKQDEAKAILSTKICTHFNRIKQSLTNTERINDMVGNIKNNVLMIGPTGVGKTYMIKLIAKKIGVPFVKGDATKFSETGYVGGDVEDLVRDLVREADDDIGLAECGIIYIDEIDKIASSQHFIGADVSRTGVQRALLKPMEETEVDLKVPHDPISMIQEVERFRKTGQRDRRTVNTKNILFIMSGAFSELAPIVKKRVSDQAIGFGAKINTPDADQDFLKQIKAEDLTAFGFESEFVGRLPVKAVLVQLDEGDLFDILNNPNNPVILGKKLDFAAYDIDVKFDNKALRLIAADAYTENTGARGLVSAVERALLLFEKRLPSSPVNFFPVTEQVVHHPEETLARLLSPENKQKNKEEYYRLVHQEQVRIKEYIDSNRDSLSDKYAFSLTAARIDLIATGYSKQITDVGTVINRMKSLYEKVKTTELSFLKDHEINIVLMEDAADHLVERIVAESMDIDDYYKDFSTEFGLGLKLVRDRIGKDRFFIGREALLDPDAYISELLKQSVEPTA